MSDQIQQSHADNAPKQGNPPRPARPNPNPLTDPVNAPLGTTVVFPRWQDEHHATDIAIRWAPTYDMDEQRPWLILGSDGPQKLDHDAVEGCEVLDYNSESRLEDALASIAHSLIELTEVLKRGVYPQRWVINNGPVDVDALKSAMNRRSTFEQRRM